MFILKFLRFIRGYVCIKAVGGFPERFINLCANQNINLRDSKIEGNTLFTYTDIKGYKRIRSPAKKSGMKVRIYKKYGLPFFLYKNKSRAGLLVGGALFVMICSFLSMFIWTIDVTGCEKIREDEILSYLCECSIKPGTKRKDIDAEQCAEQILQKDDRLSWIAINLRGCSANITLREKSGNTFKQENTQPANIVSSCDGQIERIEVYRGTKMQKENAAVLKGDILISGITENRDGSARFQRAKGYVTAKTQKKISASSKALQYKKIGKIKKSNEIYFFSFHFPISKKLDSKKFFEQSYMLFLNNTALPIGIKQKRSYILEPFNAKSNKSVTNLCVLEQFFLSMQNNLKYSEILNNSIIFSENRLSTEIKGIFMLRENIISMKNMDFE